MFRLLTLFCCVASSASAETYVADAFGILPTTAVSEDRAAWAGLQNHDGPVLVEPDESDSVLVFVGPKALVAGQDRAHAVALSFDRHGNLVQNESAVFSIETGAQLSARVTDGIADVQFMPEPTAGDYASGATVGGVQSARAIYRVTADLSSVSPTPDGAPTLRAEMFTTLSSTALQDKFGNPVEDGIGTTLLLSHENGETSLLSAPVREAKAEAILLARDLEAEGTLLLNLASASGTGSFDFRPVEAQTSPRLQLWEVPEIDAIGVRLGPVMTTAGHLLTDGAAVEIILSDDAGTRVEASGWLQDGYFEAIVHRPSEAERLMVTFDTPIGSERRAVTISMSAPAKIRGPE